jgi:hypothetical protein
MKNSFSNIILILTVFFSPNAASDERQGNNVCWPVVSLTAEHNGQKTRLELAPELSAGKTALPALQKAARYFGSAKLGSFDHQTDVRCAQSSAVATPFSFFTAINPLPMPVLCFDANFQVKPCDAGAGNQDYPVNLGTSCSTTHTGSVTFYDCDDSSALVFGNEGRVILKFNSQKMRDDMASRTDAMRRLLTDHNVLSNNSFNFAIPIDNSLAIVDVNAFDALVTTIKDVASHRQPTPKVEQLIASLPNPPIYQSLFDELTASYHVMVQKLTMLANITGTFALSPHQVQYFYQNFIENSEKIDDKLLEDSVEARWFITSEINRYIRELAAFDHASSTIYYKVRPAYEALLGAYTTQGIFDPDGSFPSRYKLVTSLTADDDDERIMAAEVRTIINSTLLRLDTTPDARILIPLLVRADNSFKQSRQELATFLIHG